MSYLGARELPFIALGLGQTIGFYTAVMPSPLDVAKGNTDDLAFAAEVRLGEQIAGGLAIAVGTAQAIHARSYVPLIYSGLAVALLVVMFEYLLRSDRPNLATPKEK